MTWIETKVVFDFDNTEWAVELISDAFYGFGLQGVVVESTDLDPPEGWGDGAQKIPEQDAVIGYFPKNDLAQDRLNQLSEKLFALETDIGIRTRVTCRDINEEDWAESWKAYFHPEKISEKIVIKPTWREYAPKPCEIILEIDPGMAFGTGAHPTTAMCIRMIEKYLVPGNSFLDVGTGSGILMIAAAKLGAGRLAGVDNDEIAVEIAEKNLLLNHIAPRTFALNIGNLADTIVDHFDIVAANILSDVIVMLLDDIPKVLKKRGIFIGSGIIEENKDMVIEKMRQIGFDIMEVQITEKWACIVGRHNIKSEKQPSDKSPG
jgi:ribosomal protein L11 methyltransferase